MSVTTTNLIQGPATLWTGIFGVAEPATPVTVPGAGWVDVGATQDGVALIVEKNYAELQADQIVDVPGQTITKRVVKVKTNLAEPTLANLALSLNELAASITAGVFTPSNGLAAFTPNYAAILFDGIGPGGLKRRIIVRRALNVANLDAAYKKDKQVLVPVEFFGHFVSASIAPFSIAEA